MKQPSLDPTVFIVDDDAGVRDATSSLMASVGLNSEVYDSAVAFLDAYQPQRRGCLVVDVIMPRLSGLELQDELIRRGTRLPVIFVSGHGDIPTAVAAMRKGAVDFIEKPFRVHALLRCIDQAIEKDIQAHEQQRSIESILSRYETLTPREREIVELLVDGCVNKVIALKLYLSRRTVEKHRANAMEKMQTGALSELVRMILQVREHTRTVESVTRTSTLSR